MTSARGGVVLTCPPRFWACPRCPRTAVTRVADPHTQMHPCDALGGVIAPYVPVPPGWQPGDRVPGQAITVHREDYERHAAYRGESLTRDLAGDPVVCVSTEHGGGMAHAIQVPCIEISMRGGGA